jgi:hypothetical protein
MFALRYSATKLSSLVYDGEALNQYTFYGSKCLPAINEQSSENPILLNGKKIKNVFYKHRRWTDVIISADELGENELSFFYSLFDAPFIYISEKSGTSWGNYIRIVFDDSKLPLSYLDDKIYLPQLTLNFSSVDKV